MLKNTKTSKNFIQVFAKQPSNYPAPLPSRCEILDPISPCRVNIKNLKKSCCKNWHFQGSTKQNSFKDSDSVEKTLVMFHKSCLQLLHIYRQKFSQRCDEKKSTIKSRFNNGKTEKTFGICQK